MEFIFGFTKAHLLLPKFLLFINKTITKNLELSRSQLHNFLLLKDKGHKPYKFNLGRLNAYKLIHFDRKLIGNKGDRILKDNK